MSAPAIVRRPTPEELAHEYFPDHRAEYAAAEVGGARVERLVWRKPGTNINRVDYLCDGGRLLVVGDLGDAIYITGAHNLAWWTRCDLYYFASKCDASEYGRGYKTWDDDACRSELREWVTQSRADDETVDADLVSDADAAILAGRHDWIEWQREHGADLFGDEWWDFVPNWGVRPDQRCALHLVGLKLAMAQVWDAAERPDRLAAVREAETECHAEEQADG